MQALARRRGALARPDCRASKALLPGATQASFTATRDIHATPARAGSRQEWKTMRVKTPWIEALTKSREAPAPSGDGATQNKPDIKPKRMSDSYYSAVCVEIPG